MVSTVQSFIPLRMLIDSLPGGTVSPQGGDGILDKFGISDFSIEEKTGFATTKLGLAFANELGFEIPGVDGLGIYFGSNNATNALAVEADITDDLSSYEIRIVNAGIIARFPPTIFRTVQWTGTQFETVKGAGGEPLPYEITVAGLTLAFDSDGDLTLSSGGSPPALTLAPMMIGDTGIVIEADSLEFYLSSKIQAPGQPSGWRGAHIQNAKLHLPGDLAASVGILQVGDAYIGSGGFTGGVSSNWPNGLAASLFGLDFMLKEVTLGFVQNVPVQSSIKGSVKLPFFDHPVTLEIGFAAGGHLTVGLDDPTGLATLHIVDVLNLELDSLKFEIDAGVLTATLSGKLTPTVPGLSWPAIALKDLKIDSKGNVKLPGGWLDLPDQYGFDFHGFQVDITKFGMGRNEDGSKWIGFSGGIKLVDGLPAGASVEGLRITVDEHWTPSSAKISFAGVGIELDAKAFYFKGSVAYREFLDPVTAQIVHRFDGDIKLKLRSPALEIDGALVIGSVGASGPLPAYNFFAIYVDVELPTGIPLGTTGLGLYGFAGLLAISMEPDKHADEVWYGIGDGQGWFKRDTIGVADLHKWRNENGSKAFGAGVTLGTYADNGYTFNGKVLLAIVFPGPIILLEGAANLLKERGSGGEPLFRSLAVLDGRADSLLIGLDVKYQYADDGKLIKIGAGTEAYYEFHNPTAWHIYLGLKEPRERRIQADILSLFEANAYFMLDAHQLAMGAWVGYDKSWQYGPLSVTLQAWMENNAVVSFKPAHLYADLWVHGAVDLKAFGFGAGLTIDARIEADVFDPFHLLGKFEVSLKLPWPLKKVKPHATVRLQWGPRPDRPALPAALKDVTIEHLKTSTTWPLPTPTLLTPNYADGDGFLQVDGNGDLLVSAPDDTAGPPPDAPVVPLDCRPSISFSRNVHDVAMVGASVQPPNPAWERIGNPAANTGPAEARYALTEVRLDKWDGSAWQPVAGKGTGNSSLPELYGTWAPVPGGNAIGQNKLLLWSKCGFDQLRHTGVEWSDWFSGAFGKYPCIPDVPLSFTCLDFEIFGRSHEGGEGSPFVHPDHPGITFIPDGVTSPLSGGAFRIQVLPNPIGGKSKVLWPEASISIQINFANPVGNLRISAVSWFEAGWAPYVVVKTASGASIGPILLDLLEVIPAPGAARLQHVFAEIAVNDATQIILTGKAGIGLLELCTASAASAQAGAQTEAIRLHNRHSTALWSGQGNVLEPYTNYRLRAVTSIVMQGDDYYGSYDLTQMTFFRTEGPPRLAKLSRPAGTAPSAEFQSGLDDLTRYVRQTIPATVPKTGELPLLPRPVYRGYDVGVQFNEDYVDLMYRLAGRDLAVIIYDRNNQPVRDRGGRLLVLDNPWGVNEQVSFNAQETPWIALMNGSPCVDPIDPVAVPRDQTLQAADPAQILDPDTLYDARLMPLLLHEDFGRISDGTLGRWQVVDAIATGGPSDWVIEQFGPAKRMRQKSAIGDASLALGTLLVLGNHPGLAATDPGQPPNWTDYRVSLYLGSSQAGTIGAAFRYVDAGTFYQFAVDLPTGVPRLVRFLGGTPTLLAALQPSSFVIGLDYHLVVEAIGSSLRVYLDDKRVFDIVDGAIAGGGLALHCQSCTGAAFSDIKVYDFGKAKSVYRFGFTSSVFVDFFHHLHSFDDECWHAPCTLAVADIAALYGRSVADPGLPIGDDEARAFERLADDCLGAAANQTAARTEVTRIERAGNANAMALLLRSPEPFDWTRLSLACSLANQPVPSPIVPIAAKFVDAVLGAQQPSDETVMLLVREQIDMTGYRIERRDFSGTSGATPLIDLDEAASDWVPIYTFGNEEPIAPGTHIVVYSGNPDSPPAVGPRTLQRFRAAPGAPGDLQFAATAVDLRLVSASGDIIHARRFLDAATYSPVAVRLLRKADGTACFLLPQLVGGEFVTSPYRLALEFRRNNTALHPDSIVLSAAGQSTTEAVVLDVPVSPWGVI
jgi:hypothetical protein